MIFIASTSVVEEGVLIGEGSRIFHFCHLMSGAKLGKECTLGQGVHIASGVEIGDRVKIQNHVSLFSGVVIEDDVFFGPNSLTTNIENPRAEISRREQYACTRVQRGASIGAGAVLMPGVTVGRFAFIAAGTIVTRDVDDYALVRGVPGRRVAWMSRHGHKLTFETATVECCAGSGLRYEKLRNGKVRCLDFDEQASLPVEFSKMNCAYRALVRGE